MARLDRSLRMRTERHDREPTLQRTRDAQVPARPGLARHRRPPIQAHGGGNTLECIQVDGPVRFAFQFCGPRKHVIGSRLNYSAGLALYHNYASLVRLEKGASAAVLGGGAKGEAAHCILQEISGDKTEYSALGFATAFVTHISEPR